ncbi:MAG: hypothetical protein H0V53_03190 [Rubrobacter sp.]|nr:hypothetical protein [Rubrobacter sp.]
MREQEPGAAPETRTPETGNSEARAPGTEELEGRLAELHRIGEELGTVPDGQLADTLERAVELVEEINASIESGISSAGREAGEVRTLLDGVDFGSFDAALGELEEPASGPDPR